MANRPQNSREWAESADAQDVSEPSTERPGGFQFEQDFNHDQFNWLVRELFRWADYFDEKFQRAQQAIDLAQSVLVGDNGEFQIPADTASDIVANFVHSGSGTSSWIADQFVALDKVIADVIESRTGAEIDFQSNGGNSQTATLLADVIKLASRVETDVIEALNGSEVQLNSVLNAVRLEGILRSAQIQGVLGSVNEAIEVRTGDQTSFGFVESANSPIGHARFQYDEGNDEWDFVTGRGFTGGVLSSDPGTFTVELDAKDSDLPTGVGSEMPAFAEISANRSQANSDDFYRAVADSSSDGSGGGGVIVNILEGNISAGSVTNVNPPDESVVDILAFYVR